MNKIFYNSLNDFNYKIENDEIILKNYYGSFSTVRIPEYYKIKDKKYYIKRITKNAFVKEDNIKKVILPNSITKLEEKAFFGCQNLQEIKLSEQTKIIEDKSFGNCKKLNKIIIPDSVTKLGSECFSGATKLKKVKFSENLTKIPEECFYNCQSLYKIIIPNKIKVIEDMAFYNCKNLYHVKLSNNIEQILDGAFERNPLLNKIYLPNTIKKISKTAFNDCWFLELNNFENQYIKIENNNIYQKENKDNKTIYKLTNCYQKENTLKIKENERIECPINDNIENIIIESEQEINHSLVNGFDITNLIIPNVTKIKFEGMEQNIENLYITNKLKKIEYQPFIVNRVYYNGTLEQFNTIKGYSKILFNDFIYQESIKELAQKGYKYDQINQILKGYQKGIFLNNINQNIDYQMLRDIINTFDYDSPELYHLYYLLEKDFDLDNEIAIQTLINNKTIEKNKENIKDTINDIEKSVNNIKNSLNL